MVYPRAAVPPRTRLFSHVLNNTQAYFQEFFPCSLQAVRGQGAGVFTELLADTLSRKEFALPVAFDLGATFFFAMTGALAAIRRHYDPVGLFVLAFVTSVGGGLLRDGIFLQQGPPAVVSDGRYILAVVAGCVATWVLASFIERFGKGIAVLDAVGLGAYGAYGVQKSLSAGLSLPAAILVGVVNACGGSVLRDVLVREEPLVFKPGQFYLVAAVFGCCLFVALAIFAGWSAPLSALVAAVATFLCRIFAIIFKWETGVVRPWFAGKPPPKA
jgi:uncharacterized membrane protein YeiH